MASPLISATELASTLGSMPVLDVRYRLGGPGGPAEFDAGHVPGAAYVDLDAELAAPPAPADATPCPPPRTSRPR